MPILTFSPVQIIMGHPLLETLQLFLLQNRVYSVARGAVHGAYVKQRAVLETSCTWWHCPEQPLPIGLMSKHHQLFVLENAKVKRKETKQQQQIREGVNSGETYSNWVKIRTQGYTLKNEKNEYKQHFDPVDLLFWNLFFFYDQRRWKAYAVMYRNTNYESFFIVLLAVIATQFAQLSITHRLSWKCQNLVKKAKLIKHATIRRKNMLILISWRSYFWMNVFLIS